MDVRDVEALKNWLSRVGDLDNANEDLIDNAIWCLKNGNEYRAISSLKGLASNLRNAGKTESAKGVERLLQNYTFISIKEFYNCNIVGLSDD